MKNRRVAATSRFVDTSTSMFWDLTVETFQDSWPVHRPTLVAYNNQPSGQATHRLPSDPIPDDSDPVKCLEYCQLCKMTARAASSIAVASAPEVAMLVRSTYPQPSSAPRM